MERRRAGSMEELAHIQGRMFDAQGVLASIKSYEPRPSDVVISPYGKSGTTWTQQIFHTLRTRGDMDFDDISRVVPWIEMGRRVDLDLNAEQRGNPRGFKSHLEFDQLPKGARYINVIRNPLDAAYSAFKFMEGWFLEVGAVDPETFVLAGTKDARYFKHFASWWPHREDENVLLLCFEHMKADQEGTIRQIAQFAGMPWMMNCSQSPLNTAPLPLCKRIRIGLMTPCYGRDQKRRSFPLAVTAQRCAQGKWASSNLVRR